MYSSKQSILETVALLKAHGIEQVVISPGSRNAPLIQCFVNDPAFQCRAVLDERSAGFVALGMIHFLKQPVVVCCTSGTALLNYGPAVAEAHYQQLPLLVISADRSEAWINQMDGQTLQQIGLFGTLFQKAVNLPEIHNDEELWQCNRLVNEAINGCFQGGGGPVHINIPISEPFFDFSTLHLPHVRKIAVSFPDDAPCTDTMVEEWNMAAKRLILVGQHPSDPILEATLDALMQRTDCTVFCEHLANTISSRFIRNFDAILESLNDQQKAALSPDLLITLGGHIVSKHVKKWLRATKGYTHWHFSLKQTLVDTYQSVTRTIVGRPTAALTQLSRLEVEEKPHLYAMEWAKKVLKVPIPSMELPFSDVVVTGCLLSQLPNEATLFVANSSPVRNIQRFERPNVREIVCNRGINGIEGGLSTVIGLSKLNRQLTIALMGDLTFFHDLSGLFSPEISTNLRIMVINNGGGGIFQRIEGLTLTPTLKRFVASEHHQVVENWAKAANLIHLKATNLAELNENLPLFVRPDQPSGIVLEVLTTTENNLMAEDLYAAALKKAQL